MTVLATSNLDFGRGWRAHRRDIRAIFAADPAVVVACLQELRRPLRDAFKRLARIIQRRRPGGAPGSEGIVVRRGTKILARGSRLASHNKFGEQIGWRRIPWVVIATAWGPLAVVCYHRVPLRMQDGPLDEAQDATLRDLLDHFDNESIPWVVLGDMNQLQRADPADLARDFHAKWVGSRIDLAAVHPRLHVADTWERQDARRRDHHPVLYVDITKENR